jgi:hypothetical protein
MVDLSAFLGDDTNLVEIFLCPGGDPLQVGWAPSLPIPASLGTGIDVCVKEYHHRDMVYSFEAETDAQRAWRKTLQMDQWSKPYYIASYLEETIPVHRFPCTQEVAYEVDVHRTSFRINNRMFLYHDREHEHEYLYLRYVHAPNVDVKKMQQDLDRTLSKLRVLTRKGTA